jgi:hypothetical protein
LGRGRFRTGEAVPNVAVYATVAARSNSGRMGYFSLTVIKARGNGMRGRWGLALGAALLSGCATPPGDDSTDAALGGAVGGGLGALVGNEVSGRDGAIVGGALGAAAGAAVATDYDRGYRYRRRYDDRYYRRYDDRPPERFCPPGHAKKGWCW